MSCKISLFRWTCEIVGNISHVQFDSLWKIADQQYVMITVEKYCEDLRP